MTYSRRSFLRLLLCVLAGCAAPSAVAAERMQTFSGSAIFERIVARAHAEGWRDLPIGELMGKIAMQFESTPYKSGTLDVSTSNEVCTVNLGGLDCVTFFETTLDMARMLKHGKSSEEALVEEVRFTRYRDGKQGDYSTRLHYTSDWFLDNERKGVVTLLSKLPGSQPFHPGVAFMSEHPQLYPQLAANSNLVNEIKAHETRINTKQLMYVPIDQLAAVEPYLQTGDIVGLCGRVPGLDVDHTGLVIRQNGVAHFMDASSRKATMKVTLEDGPLHEAITRSNKIKGAILARPNNVT